MRTTLSLFVLAAVTLVTPAIAAASQRASPSPTSFATGAHYAIVAPDGHLIATVVVVEGAPRQLQVIGRTVDTVTKRTPDVFNPDIAHALGPQQMNEAWQAEIDRFYHVDHS